MSYNQGQRCFFDRENTKNKYNKQINKVVMPFLCSVFYMFCADVYTTQKGIKYLDFLILKFIFAKNREETR